MLFKTVPYQAGTPTQSALSGWIGILFLSALYLIAYIDRLVLIVLVEPLKLELGLTDTQIGLLVGTSFALFYTAVALPISRIADRANRRDLIFFGALLWNVMTACSAFANSFATLLVLRVGVAIGEAVLVPAALSMIGDFFPRDRRALPTSIFVGAGATGSPAALVVAAAGLQFAGALTALPGLGALTPWRITLLMIGLGGGLMSILFRLAVREPARPAATAAIKGPLFEAVTHLRSHLVTYIGFIGATTLIATVTISYKVWFPNALIRVHGMTPAQAGYIFGLIGIVTTIVGGLTIPNLANRIYRRGRQDAMIWTALCCILAAAPLFIASLLVADTRLALGFSAAAVLIQLGLGIMMTTTLSLLPPPHLRAQVTAVYLLCTNIVGLGGGPLVVALLSDHLFTGADGLSSALVTLLAVLVPLQMLLLLWARASFSRTITESALLERPLPTG